MNKYIVIKNLEWFKRIEGIRYQYQHLQDTNDRWLFNSEKEARKFMDSYNLKIEATSSDIYLDALDLYKYDAENDDIVENSELIYSSAINIDEFNAKNIKQLIY